MSTYQFSTILYSSVGIKTYRMGLRAHVNAEPNGESGLTFSFDEYNPVPPQDIKIANLPMLLFSDATAKYFKNIDTSHNHNEIYMATLNLNTESDKAVALHMLDRLLSFKDIGKETRETAIITGIASKLKYQSADQTPDAPIISANGIALFSLYQVLGGTKTLEDFAAQAPAQPMPIPTNFGQGSRALYTIAGNDTEDQDRPKPKSHCCLLL